MSTRGNLTLVAVSSLLALAACASTPSGTSNNNASAPQLASSSDILEKNARVLADRSDAVTPSFQADAHELQRNAFEFHAAAASGRVSDQELRADFDQVTRSYLALRDDVAHLGTVEVQADFELVQNAYRDVASQMGGSTESPGQPGS
jgi:hypothetical protein